MEGYVDFRYSMLSRLQMDCKYYLGNGNRNKKHLWGDDEVKHICEMKRIYNSFRDDQKPEWITYENIIEFENQMIKEEF